MKPVEDNLAQSRENEERARRIKVIVFDVDGVMTDGGLAATQRRDQFEPGIVGAALGLGPVPTLQRFGKVEKKHRLIRSAGRNYAFDHHQVQETLYAGLFEQLRDRLLAGTALVVDPAQHLGQTLDPGAGVGDQPGELLVVHDQRGLLALEHVGELGTGEPGVHVEHRGAELVAQPRLQAHARPKLPIRTADERRADQPARFREGNFLL